MKLIGLLFFFLIFSPFSSKGQSANFLLSAKQRFHNQHSLPDAIIDTIIIIAKNKSNNDSLRVGAVHLLYEIKCDSCIVFLINNVSERFNYGEGISDLDQSNYSACWTDLLKLSQNSQQQWKLFLYYLYCIKTIERDDRFNRALLPVLFNITSKDALKAILKEELRKNDLQFSKKNLILEKNIFGILNKIH